MAFREVSVVRVKEALRRWLNGDGERPIAWGVGVDRKRARRYIAAAVELASTGGGGVGCISGWVLRRSGQFGRRGPKAEAIGRLPAWPMGCAVPDVNFPGGMS
jgi:hypothetical protein